MKRSTMKYLLIFTVSFCGTVITSSAQTILYNTIFCSSSGNISIGTTKPANSYVLSVSGKIMTGGTRIVKLSAWPDYVFENDYPLTPLPDLKKYIDGNHHLPGVSEAATVRNSGTDVAETSAMILKKTEELTLYLLQLDQRSRALEEKK